MTTICYVCDLPVDDEERHTYHHEGCPARLDGWGACSCGGLEECHPSCCPSCVEKHYAEREGQ